MSLETWKAEFYPVPASKCPKKDALRRSLQKWLGLRKTSLKRHGIEQEVACLTDGECALLMSDTTCPLCRWHRDCSGCPLLLVRGVCCFEDDDDSLGGPWNYWRATGDPNPMIHLIRKAIKKQGAKP